MSAREQRTPRLESEGLENTAPTVEKRSTGQLALAHWCPKRGPFHSCVYYYWCCIYCGRPVAWRAA